MNGFSKTICSKLLFKMQIIPLHTIRISHVFCRSIPVAYLYRAKLLTGAVTGYHWYWHHGMPGVFNSDLDFSCSRFILYESILLSIVTLRSLNKGKYCWFATLNPSNYCSFMLLYCSLRFEVDMKSQYC